MRSPAKVISEHRADATSLHCSCPQTGASCSARLTSEAAPDARQARMPACPSAAKATQATQSHRCLPVHAHRTLWRERLPAPRLPAVCPAKWVVTQRLQRFAGGIQWRRNGSGRTAWSSPDSLPSLTPWQRTRTVSVLSVWDEGRMQRGLLSIWGSRGGFDWQEIMWLILDVSLKL